MNLRQNQKGFTIVELLIVVVVIAILAAISIVAYTGITNRANTSAALEAANSTKSVATAYNGANGSWPTTEAQFINGGTEALAKLPSDILFLNTAYGTSGATAITAVQTSPVAKELAVFNCGTTGIRIYYYDFTAAIAKSMDAGDCSGANAPLAAANSIQ